MSTYTTAIGGSVGWCPQLYDFWESVGRWWKWMYSCMDINTTSIKTTGGQGRMKKWFVGVAGHSWDNKKHGLSSSLAKAHLLTCWVWSSARVNGKLVPETRYQIMLLCHCTHYQDITLGAIGSPTTHIHITFLVKFGNLSWTLHTINTASATQLHTISLPMHIKFLSLVLLVEQLVMLMKYFLVLGCLLKYLIAINHTQKGIFYFNTDVCHMRCSISKIDFSPLACILALCCHKRLWNVVLTT